MLHHRCWCQCHFWPVTGQAQAEMLESQPYRDHSHQNRFLDRFSMMRAASLSARRQQAIANPTGEQQAQRPYPTGDLALRMLQEELKTGLRGGLQAAAIKIFANAGAPSRGDAGARAWVVRGAAARFGGGVCGRR